MAEALGLAASIISVVSFAIQLADSVQKACDFWESVEDAPDDIVRLSKELRLLSSILRFISHEHTSGVSDATQDSLVMSALQLAKEDVNELNVLVTELSSKIGPARGKMKRKWGQVRIALKSEKIRKMKEHVESAKSTLNMLQASRAHVTMCQMNGRLELLSSTLLAGMQTQQRVAYREELPSGDTQNGRRIETIATASQRPRSSESSALRTRTKTSWTSINAGLALLTFQTISTTFCDLEKDQDEEDTKATRKTFNVSFLWGYSSCRRGVRMSTTNRFDLLTLNSVRRRPNDSQIFMFCRIGDTMGVKKLLQTGEASLFDTDEDGYGLLHGIDYYMKSDNGNSALDELRNYDEANKSREGRNEITRITETLLRETDFDPLNVQTPGSSYGTLVLWNGLPYEALKYLLSQDSRVITTGNCFDLLYENMFAIQDPTDDFEDCIDLLLTKYEELRGDSMVDNGYYWPHTCTLLQTFIQNWIYESVIGTSGAETKICRCLTLTMDLYNVDEKGTCLDLIASLDQGYVQPWLELLARNGVDIAEYLQYEFDQHPEGMVDQWHNECCRLISLRFQHEDDKATGVEVENVCKPEYVRFHPEYMCEAGKRRERCITQLHDVVIDESGKPKQNVPGSWSQVLKPNSECSLILRKSWCGKEYVEGVEKGDYVWNEETGKWVDSDLEF